MSIISDNSSMESLNPKYKCKGCSKVLSVNSIMKHIVNKPDCLNLYSQKDLDEQKRLCKDHLRNKRVHSNKQYYQSRKKQRNLEEEEQGDWEALEQDRVSKVFPDVPKTSPVEEVDFEEVELPLDIFEDMMNDDNDGHTDNSEEEFVEQMKKSSDQEDFYCKGCFKWFKNNSILKHLKSPKVDCMNKYHSYEIQEMENISKLRRAMTDSIWHLQKRKNDPDYHRRINYDYTIRRNIDLCIYKITRKRKQETYLFRNLMRNLQKAFMAKIDFERTEMLSLWNKYLFNQTPSISMPHIAQWRKEIVSEINETYGHLKKEIEDTVEQYHLRQKPLMEEDLNSYYNHESMVIEKNAVVLISKASEYINKNKVVLISEGSKYTILKSSISNEMKSLLHYIEWRLENSYAMIVWKTIKLAEDINRKMSEEYFQYYTEIKTKKKKYDSLAHLKEFQNITYTECKPVKFDGDFKSKKSFPYYNEIVSTQIPHQEPYVPLFDVEESFISKLVVESSEYIPSEILKCSYSNCNYSCLDRTPFVDHISMYHCGTRTDYNTCRLLQARIAYGKKRLDPNYLGSFDFKSPLTLDHFIKTDQ